MNTTGHWIKKETFTDLAQGYAAIPTVLTGFTLSQRRYLSL
jgi:hypothetical protein